MYVLSNIPQLSLVSEMNIERYRETGINISIKVWNAILSPWLFLAIFNCSYPLCVLKYWNLMLIKIPTFFFKKKRGVAHIKLEIK